MWRGYEILIVGSKALGPVSVSYTYVLLLVGTEDKAVWCFSLVRVLLGVVAFFFTLRGCPVWGLFFSGTLVGAANIFGVSGIGLT